MHMLYVSTRSELYCATVTRHNERDRVETCLFHDWIDGVFCVRRACDEQARDTFWSSRFRLEFMGGYNTPDTE